MPDDIATTSLTAGIGHVVLSVSNLGAARAFYTGLGLKESLGESWPTCRAHIVFRMDGGQALVLAEGDVAEDIAASAAHVGIAMTPDARERIRAGTDAVFTYSEDNPAEADDNFYVVDPSGNRLQIVARDGIGAAGAIDHVAIEVTDIMWAQAFYGDGLGWKLTHRVGWCTDDYLKAKARGEDGIADALPGSRYINERYSQFETERRAVRPNPQLYLDAGGGNMVAVYLAARHYKAPPDGEHKGVPRLGLRAGVALDRIAATLEKYRIPSDGPVSHDAGAPFAGSLFIRDQGGNFIEFTTGA